MVQSMNRGGIENFLMNIYRHIDREKIQFDFLLNEQNRSDFEDEIESLGGKIHRMPRLKLTNPFNYIKAVDKFFKEHPDYRICHSHYNAVSAIPLGVAKHNGVKYRITHSHIALPKGGKTKNPKIVIFALKHLLKRIPTHRFACGQAAGEWLFGEKAAERGEVKIIHNSIETERFNFNPKVRAEIRAELNIPDSAFVVGNIGRFSYQKNHRFAIEILNGLLKIIPETVFLFVGDGALRQEIEQYAKDSGVANHCIFTGVVPNSCDYAQAMDVFILPSHLEGLPLVSVEAQTAGLKCFISTGVSQECKVTDLVEFLPLSAGAERWAEAIAANRNYPRRGRIDEIRAAGYDAAATAVELQNFYLNLFNEQ